MSDIIFIIIIGILLMWIFVLTGINIGPRNKIEETPITYRNSIVIDTVRKIIVVQYDNRSVNNEFVIKFIEALKETMGKEYKILVTDSSFNIDIK